MKKMYGMMPFVLTLWLAAVAVLAAPIASLGLLPIDDQDIEKIKAHVNGDEKLVEKFLITLNQLRVFPDHANPDDPSMVSNRGMLKKFWATPLLSPSQEKEVLGSLAIAEYGLTIIDEIEKIANTIDVDIRRAVMINDLILAKNDRLLDLDTELSDSRDEILKNLLLNEKAMIAEEISRLEQKLDEVKDKNKQGFSKHSQIWVKRAIDEIVRQLSRLGAYPTSEEQTLLSSTSASDINFGLAKLRARTATGQFGIQQVSLESGLNDLQVDILGLYSSIRPDVQIQSLRTISIYARPASQTTVDVFENRDGGLPAMIRAVNGGTKKGDCGASATCNVVIEYTEMGARWAGGATTGSVFMPVYFQADVEYIEPEFFGSLECKFKNGLLSNGRLDIKDGGLIYDHDVTNKIKFKNVDEGGCNFDVRGGTKDSAEYHAFNNIYNNYIQIRFQRAQKSEKQMESEEKKLKNEIEQIVEKLKTHPPDGQREGMVQMILKTLTSGEILVKVVNMVDKFFWHTTILETESISEVNLSETINIKNRMVRELRSYDAFPVLCWKNGVNGDTSRPFPSACATETLLNRKEPDSIVGRTQENCNAKKTPYRSCGLSVGNRAKTNPFGERVI